MMTGKTSLIPQLLAAIVFCIPAALKASPNDTPQQRDPLRVIVLTGGHKFDEQPFYALFAGFGDIKIDHAKLQKSCTFFDDISQWDYDVIVFYHFGINLSKKGQENLLKLCSKGVGIVVVHHAIAGFPEWQTWRKIVGAKYFLADTEEDGVLWKRCTYKHGVTFKINIENPKSPVTAGLADFDILDETYKGYRLEPGNRLLLTTKEPLSQKEISWTRTFDKSRVCYIQSGHGKDAYGNPNFRKLLKQAIIWAGKKPAPVKPKKADARPKQPL